MRAVAWTLPVLCMALCHPAFAQTETTPAVPATPANPAVTTPSTEPPAAPAVPTTPSTPAPTVTDVTITGNTLIPTSDIQGVVALKPGVPFSRDQYQKDADAIEKLYTDRGYQAVVSPAATSIDANGAVHFQITEAVVESIAIRGNHKTKRRTFLKVIETRPGQLYRREQAQADVRNLYNLGIFEDVTYHLDAGSTLGQVVVVYDVTEMKTGQVSAGLSYSGSSGIIGQVMVLDTNLGGRANALGAFIQSGGKYYRSGGEIDFHNPFVDRSKTALDLGVYAKSIYRFSGYDVFSTDFGVGQGYDEFRTGGDFSLSRRIGRSLSAAIGFRGNGVKARYTYDVVANVPNPEGTGSHLIYVGEGRNPGITDGNVFVGTFGLADDHRDYALDPGNGGVQVAALDLGSVHENAQTVLIGANANGAPITESVPSDSGAITRLSFDVRQYWSHGRTDKDPTKAVPVIAARLVGGTVGGTVPFWEQFFVGGIGIGGIRYARFVTSLNAYEDPFITSSMPLRGYTEGRFWGRNMLAGSLEYRIPLGQGIRGVVFTDFGDAWSNDVKVLDPYEIDPKRQDDSFLIHSSVGLGLRVATPIGPIRVDFGVGSEGTRTHFSVGQVF